MQGLVLLFTAPIARFDLLALLGPPKLELIQETIHLGRHVHQLMNSEVVSNGRPVGEQCIERRIVCLRLLSIASGMGQGKDSRLATRETHEKDRCPYSPGPPELSSASA